MWILSRKLGKFSNCWKLWLRYLHSSHNPVNYLGLALKNCRQSSSGLRKKNGALLRMQPRTFEQSHSWVFLSWLKCFAYSFFQANPVYFAVNKLLCTSLTVLKTVPWWYQSQIKVSLFLLYSSNGSYDHSSYHLQLPLLYSSQLTIGWSGSLSGRCGGVGRRPRE